MSEAVLVVRLLLAGVLVAAGLAKLRDLDGSREAARQFGVPARLAGGFGTVLPLVELAVAAALLPAGSARLGALGALVLLVAFTAAIVVALARGRQPDCHCFGQLRSSPISLRTLARNLLLAGVAGFAVVGGWADPGRSAVAWIAHLSTPAAAGLGGALALGLILGVQVWFWFALLQQNTRLLLRLEAIERLLGAGEAEPDTMADWKAGLPVGAEAPEFELARLGGGRLSLQALRARGRPVLLLFTDPGCGPCNALLPDVARWQAEEQALTLAAISVGSKADNTATFTKPGVRDVLLQREREVADAYQAGGTPSAVLVSRDGRIASPVAGGAKRIRTLVDHVSRARLEVIRVSGGNGASAPHAAQQHAIGRPAPTIELPDLDGRTVSLADFWGSQTLVLFWDPGCGFCQRMLPELKAWEHERREGGPQVLVVSTGEVEVNREMGIASPIVLDPQGAVRRAYAAGGTPMAVLIDAEGRLASGVVAGAEAVMALARGQTVTPQRLS